MHQVKLNRTIKTYFLQWNKLYIQCTHWHPVKMHSISIAFSDWLSYWSNYIRGKLCASFVICGGFLFWNLFVCVLDDYRAAFSRYCLPSLLILQFGYCCILLRTWKPRSNTQMAVQMCARAHIIKYIAISFRALAKCPCLKLCQKIFSIIAMHTQIFAFTPIQASAKVKVPIKKGM